MLGRWSCLSWWCFFHFYLKSIVKESATTRDYFSILFLVDISGTMNNHSSVVAASVTTWASLRCAQLGREVKELG